MKFVSFVLDDAQQTWSQVLPQQGIPYRHAKLVLFRDATYSGCGSARSATGPFYCPATKRFTSTLASMTSLSSALARPEISLKLMCLPTNSGITCRN